MKRQDLLALAIDTPIHTQITIRSLLSVMILNMVKQIDDLMKGKLHAYVI